ncbi:MAG: zinc carboxypeptidase, partial [Bacteroidota bacterium]
FHYQTRRNASYTVTSQDLVIPGKQPKAVLAQVLFEPKTYVEDSLTYDITAWSAPYFYGLDAYANEFSIGKLNEAGAVASPAKEVTAPYALIAKYNSLEDGEFLAALLKENLKVRVLTTNTELDGKSFDAGSMVITQTANKQGYERTVYRLAKDLNRDVEAVGTGFANYGKDLGSSAVELLRKPKVGLVGGEGTSSLVFGQVRYYFEQEVKYPCTVLRTDYLSSVNLDKYDVLIFPSGGIRSSGEAFDKQLTAWVRAGGKLILMGSALGVFKDDDQTSLATYFDDAEEKALADGPVTKAQALATNAQNSRNWLDDAIPGAIYEVTLDPSDKMAYGLEGNYFSLKTSGERFAYLKSGSNAGTIRSEKDLIAGFVGVKRQKKLAETLVFGTESMGRGTMVYLVDNPLFRSFWYEGKILFTNAVFLAD